MYLHAQRVSNPTPYSHYISTTLPSYLKMEINYKYKHLHKIEVFVYEAEWLHYTKLFEYLFKRRMSQTLKRIFFYCVQFVSW